MENVDRDPRLVELVEGALDETARKIAALTETGNEENLVTLERLLSFRAGGLFEKHAVPHLVCLGMLQHGPKGVQALLRALKTAPGSIYPTNILKAIFYSSDGKLP